MQNLPNLGVGLGYREAFRSAIFLNRDKIDFLEITSDHYLDATPKKLDELEVLREHFTLIPHSLELSLGSAEGVDEKYLDKLALLVERVNPPWISDHVCFTRSNNIRIGHLAPVPFTDEALDVFSKNIERVKERIATPLILENITYNLEYPSSRMSEPQFVARLLAETDCGLLLDAANLYINSVNLGYDWGAYLDALPPERIVQLHFVGYRSAHGRLIDAHADRTNAQIWEVFEEICRRYDIKGAILERDENFPDFSEIAVELETARHHMNTCRPPAKVVSVLA